ncbi:uncharacterized protein LOC135196327 isoform X1 [Macrobrachium nipponense]|uniref:uncharacterized protein LOC135196327 isoform X1 n=1 Tax=Macrobrachium nipponense TaxID=159736 RepID=UPI0030C82A21
MSTDIIREELQNESSMDANNLQSFKSGETHPPGKSSPSYIKWRRVAIALCIITLLLAVGLSTAFGIFLAKTECGPPPMHNLATTNYLGSAGIGSKISYVCPSPYVFPNDENTFVVSCEDNLEWDTLEIPPCVRQAQMTCEDLVQDENFSLSANIEDKISKLVVSFLLKGDIPSTFSVDLYSKEDRRCTANQDNQQKLKLTSFVSSRRFPSNFLWKGPREASQDMYTIMVGDTKVNPVLPYEIRIRASGDVMAISFIQSGYNNITLFSLSRDLHLSNVLSAQKSDEHFLHSVLYTKQLGL